MTARCELTDLLVDQCAHCLGHQSVQEQIDEERAWTMDLERGGRPGGWFTASWAGECSCCGDPIHPGDTIRADGFDGYELKGCGQ